MKLINDLINRIMERHSSSIPQLMHKINVIKFRDSKGRKTSPFRAGRRLEIQFISSSNLGLNSFY